MAQRRRCRNEFSFPRALCVAAAAIAACALPALGAEPAAPKRVLILESFARDVAPFNAGAAGFREALLHGLPEPADLYEVALDTARFPDPGSEAAFADHLQDRFATRKLDLIAAIGSPAAQFIVRHGERVSPGTPMVVVGGDRVLRSKPLPGAAIVAGTLDPPALIEDIFSVLPDTKNIVVVLGASPLEKFWLEELQREFRRFEGLVTFTWLHDLPMAEVEKRVATSPPQSAIVFGLLLIDATGIAFRNNDALVRLKAVANAPVFGFFHSQLGHGIVGGRLYQDHAVGMEAGRVAISILRGDPARAEPRLLPVSKPVYDWRELERWRIEEHQLPTGAEMRYRPATFWENYRTEVAITLAVLVVQMGLIAGLLLQRRHRHTAERVALRSEATLREVTEATGIVPWEADPDTWRFTFVGAHAASLLGYPLERWHEKDFWTSHIYSADRDEAVRTCLTRSRNPGTFAFDYRMVAASGELVWVHDVVNCEHRDGRLVRLRGLISDVTEHKRLEELFRIAVEASSSATVMVDKGGSIVLVNAHTERLFGYARKELIGQQVEILMPERSRALHPGYWQQFLAAPSARSMGAGGDLFARRKDGSEFLVEVALNPIQSGERFYVLIAIVDITERKRIESELRQQRDELAHVSRVSALGELAASLAHELNQPLTAILSNVQAAQRFLASGRAADLNEVREILRDVVEDNNRASEVIRRMRALAQKERLELRPLDLTVAIQEVVKLAHSDAVSRNIRVVCDFPLALPRVQGDRIQLQQVVLNLLLNAFDAQSHVAPGEREVALQAQTDRAGMVQVAVRDRGAGLASDALRRIFEPFYTTKADGLGMGLSISRSIIEAHGGQLWAENNADRGATFYFTVPAEIQAPTEPLIKLPAMH